MNDTSKSWDADRVRTWLDRRLEAARLDQAAADKRGYGAENDYDAAAAEEWVCRALQMSGKASDQAEFATHVKALLAKEEYPATSIHDDRRFDRAVRATLRKIAKMTKANEGFENTLHYQR
jgi:hypothetical protein